MANRLHEDSLSFKFGAVNALQAKGIPLAISLQPSAVEEKSSLMAES
jgi:hypothetical protein